MSLRPLHKNRKPSALRCFLFHTGFSRVRVPAPPAGYHFIWCWYCEEYR